MRNTDVKARFLSHVELVENGCWLWRGCINKQGYGSFKFDTAQGAHRVSYKLFVGEIEEGLCVDHDCHNKDVVHWSLLTYRG